MLVIIHGWSDTHVSFKRLAKQLLDDNVVGKATLLRLGDYVSLDDDVSFDDLAHALNRAWAEQKLPDTPRSVDIVVHSTGALVLRHWMTTFHTPASNPVHRLLMLAPANFGSPLAHKGRSFVGRIVKGFNSDRAFHTGAQILKGLELASPFSWNLALKDRFGQQAWYGPGRILCTVLVGTEGYSGISAAANENGTDGTVRVSTANLNPLRVCFDFASNPQKPTLSLQPANGITAFARIDEENHSTIAWKDRGPRNPLTRRLVRDALQVTDASFPAFAAALEQLNEHSRRYGAYRAHTQPYQNTVVRLDDNLGNLVGDYFLEMFAKQPDANKVDDEHTALIQQRVLDKVHVYGDAPAYRSMQFNIQALQQLRDQLKRPLFVSVTAMPDIKRTKTVGYATFGYDDIGSIKLTPALLDQLFQPDRSVLLEMTILRGQQDQVFRILPATND